MTRKPWALKAKYRSWSKKGKDVDSWRKLLDEIAVTLHQLCVCPSIEAQKQRRPRVGSRTSLERWLKVP